LQQGIEKTGQITDEKAVLNGREDVSGIMALAGLSRSAKASLQHGLDERRGRLLAPSRDLGLAKTAVAAEACGMMVSAGR
jgi:hypothetical protein